MPTLIRPCTCKHPAQDRIHGPHNRVMNLTTKGNEIWRCSVCKTEHTIQKKTK